MKTMTGKKSLIWLLLAALVVLQGCGFQLRSASPLPSGIGPVYIKGLGQYDNLRKELSFLLQESATRVSDTPQDSASILAITAIKRDRRTLSVDANGNVAEYELREGVTFELTGRNGETLVSPQSLNTVQPYINSEDLVLGKQQEENDLRADMQRDLAGRIMRRLHAQLR
jgi:LPS-assembly lipoprotein